MITPEAARDLLSAYLGNHNFPTKDEVIFSLTSYGEPGFINYSYTFVGLLKIAYNLKDNE